MTMEVVHFRGVKGMDNARAHKPLRGEDGRPRHGAGRRYRRTIHGIRAQSFLLGLLENGLPTRD
jgi:hypothetical protein